MSPHARRLHRQLAALAALLASMRTDVRAGLELAGGVVFERRGR